MAKFLNTSATSYFLEELIKNARERVIIISPFLKLNDRIKELLTDKDLLRIDVRIIYGKSELQPEEANWLKELSYVRTGFCKNLHAKCYMNEALCIITSLNLYEFSQVNNNEMGVLIHREEDPELYKDAYEEAQRLIRASEERTGEGARISPERVSENEEEDKEETSGKLPSSKLAQKHGLKTSEFIEKLIARGYLTMREEKTYLTKKGKEAGGEFRTGRRFGPYFLWPENLAL